MVILSSFYNVDIGSRFTGGSTSSVQLQGRSSENWQVVGISNVTPGSTYVFGTGDWEFSKLVPESASKVCTLAEAGGNSKGFFFLSSDGKISIGSATILDNIPNAISIEIEYEGGGGEIS